LHGGFDRAACPLCRRPIASARFEASGLDKPRTLGRGAPRRLATNGRVFGSAYISLCAPPADELKVVLDGANILYANQGQRNWEALRCAVEHFRGSGIQPIVALSAGEFASVPPLAVGDARLKDFVAVASRGFGSTDGEADDVLVVALSEYFKCPFVPNDSFNSWSSLVSAPRRAWIEKAGRAGLRLSHDFVNIPGKGGVFLTEPQYPVELARRLPAAFTVRAAPRVEAARRNVVLALTRVYGADRQPLKAVFEASDDVDFMREKVLDWFDDGDRSKRAPTAFLYGADGVALENGTSRLADVFSGEWLSQAKPARVFVLLAEAPAASEVAEIFFWPDVQLYREDVPAAGRRPVLQRGGVGLRVDALRAQGQRQLDARSRRRRPPARRARGSLARRRGAARLRAATPHASQDAPALPQGGIDLRLRRRAQSPLSRPYELPAGTVAGGDAPGLQLARRASPRQQIHRDLPRWLLKPRRCPVEPAVPDSRPRVSRRLQRK
jgi:hypothetical protein